jgi:hypothetical protein
VSALARPLSAEEHEETGQWVEAACAYADLGRRAYAAGLLQAHDEPFKAAELWLAEGQPERAAQLYEAAGAWRQAAELWAELRRPLKQAAALEGYARTLDVAASSAAERAEAWQAAAQLFESEAETDRATACRREVAHCLQQPILALDVQHQGLELDAWSRLSFTVRNEGYGPARDLVIHARGDQFEGQVMATRQIATLRAGGERTDWLDVRPRAYGNSVPLRITVEYEGQDRESCICEQTIYLSVMQSQADQGTGQVVYITTAGGAVSIRDGVDQEGKGVLEVVTPLIEERAMPIRILFLAANPADTSRLRLDEESRAIDAALRQSEYRDRFEIQQHWAVRVSDLQGLLLRHQPDILHFCGHGSAFSEILLLDDTGRSHPVSVRALSSLFSVLQDNIRCVVLNACYSEPQARAIAEHVDCVVGMSKAIGDRSAISFATAFYQALGYGRDVQTAFDLGKVQIDLENLHEQDTPQLLALKGDPGQVIFVDHD